MAAPSKRTFGSTLWFWAKVGLCLVALDAALFGTGWFWRLAPLPAASHVAGSTAHGIFRKLATHRDGEPLALAVGSSVVRMSIPEPRLERRLRRHDVPSRFVNLGIDGGHAQDAALTAHVARERQPWLVIYGVAFRDFMTSEQRALVTRHFLDSSVDLDVLAPESVDEWLSRGVGRYWQLYRYRDLVRGVLDREGSRLGDGLVPEAHANPLGPINQMTPEERFSHRGTDTEVFRLWKMWFESRRWEDYDAYLRKRPKVAPLYRKRAARKLDLDGNPEVASLEWMLRTQKERGTRVVVIYFPENPLFRRPKAAQYFNPEHSDQVADLVERLCAQFGARFVDLRSALDPDAFYDMVHVNMAGRRRLTQLLAKIIAQEWRAANEAEALRGSRAP